MFYPSGKAYNYARRSRIPVIASACWRAATQLGLEFYRADYYLSSLSYFKEMAQKNFGFNEVLGCFALASTRNDWVFKVFSVNAVTPFLNLFLSPKL